MGKRIFDASGWFAINNAVFDVIMPNLSPNAFKVLCVAIRQTLGWADGNGGRKKTDKISYSQFMEKAGIGSKTTVSKALTECLEAGYLLRHEVGRAQGTNQPLFAYCLNTEYELRSAGTETVPDANPSGTETVPTAGTETVPMAGTETGQTKRKKRKENKGAAASADAAAALAVTSDSHYQALVKFGIAEDTARRLAWKNRNSPDRIRTVINYAKKHGKENPPGLAIYMLQHGGVETEQSLDDKIPILP